MCILTAILCHAWPACPPVTASMQCVSAACALEAINLLSCCLEAICCAERCQLPGGHLLQPSLSIEEAEVNEA